MKKMITFFLLSLWLSNFPVNAQSWELTQKNIDSAYQVDRKKIAADPFRPGFHLTPPKGCMGDPNGGIFMDGWYHIFYGLAPFSFHPGGWFWAHARSKDLLHWEHMAPSLTPAFELGQKAVGSGSTIALGTGEVLAFYSHSNEGAMKFWRAQFTNDSLTEWSHKGKNPILTLNHTGLPPYDGFWRDPFVFSTSGRTFLIACADLFEEDTVQIPIFEATDSELQNWEYKGILLSVPKHRYRNLEVLEMRPLGDKWIFMASTDAPVDRVNYFLGDFDLSKLKLQITAEGAIDYSGHYYAQESILDDSGNLYLMAWLPGWDREWLPYYMNSPLKNRNPLWNGCFAIPRKLSLEHGKLIQQPVPALQELRGEEFTLKETVLEVKNSVTALKVIEDFQSDQFEMNLEMKLYHASFCGVNVLSDKNGIGGLSIVWSGDILNVDGVRIPLEEWTKEDQLTLKIFVDRKFVEVFVNGGKYCISRQVQEEHVKGQHIALTALGGTAKLISLTAWKLNAIAPY